MTKEERTENHRVSVMEFSLLQDLEEMKLAVISFMVSGLCIVLKSVKFCADFA